MLFAKVSESENDEAIEVPIEPQGYLLMSTLTAQFPGACGLKFKSEQFSWRGVRVVEDKLYPPDEKWDTSVYIVTYPKDSKRKGDDLDINSAKSRKIERKCVDLIVLGIPWKSTEDVTRRYFEQYGEVVLCEIKRDSSGNSKGFGFVRFKEYNNQCAVLGKKHYIDGRWCDVKIPNSQDCKEPETSRKIFVGRLSENLTAKDLQDYFTQFGQVIDVYIPKPFRAFGFVTFVEAEIAQGLCGESHIIKGASVHVSRADPKEEDRSRNESNGGSGMNRFPRGTNGNSNHHLSNTMSSSSIGNGSAGGGSSVGSGTKSMNMRRKYDSHSMNNVDLYESRSHDIRSPGLPSSHHHHGGGGGSSNGGHHGHHEQMNAMMNMFNPMMAAFIQQLASGIQPTSASQSQLDSHNGGGGGGGVPSMAHHHGVPPPWATPNDYISRNGGGVLNANSINNGGMPNSLSAYNSNGYGSAQHRFKNDKF